MTAAQYPFILKLIMRLLSILDDNGMDSEYSFQARSGDFRMKARSYKRRIDSSVKSVVALLRCLLSKGGE